MATQPGAKSYKILLTGGGTGGHITPLLAIAEELKSLNPSIMIVSVGDHGNSFADLTRNSQFIDKTRSIFAGKLRRYHGESWLKRILDMRTNVFNLRDSFYIFIGVMQSIVMVMREKPDLVFLKGGYVGVPVGLAAAFWRVPIITHDSDALPGLANRIISRWVTVHATAMPPSYYKYNPAQTVQVGVLVGRQYSPVDDQIKRLYREELGIPVNAKMLFITGGSLGSQRINAAVVGLIDELLSMNQDLYVVHQVGKNNTPQYKDYTNDRLQVLEFLEGMHRYSGAADVIVTRAGANTIAEFGIQKKACIIIPSPFLSGGHQLKNGEFLETNGAAIIVDEQVMINTPVVLRDRIEELLNNDVERLQLGQRLSDLTIPNAANKLAVLLLSTIEGSVKK